MSWSGSAPLQIGLSIRQRSPPPLIISLSSGNVLIFSPKLLRSPRTSSRSRRSVDFLSPIKVETRPTARLLLPSLSRQTFSILPSPVPVLILSSRPLLFPCVVVLEDRPPSRLDWFYRDRQCVSYTVRFTLLTNTGTSRSGNILQVEAEKFNPLFYCCRFYFHVNYNFYHFCSFESKVICTKFNYNLIFFIIELRVHFITCLFWSSRNNYWR